MFLFKNEDEECSSFLHDLIVSIMEQWPRNKEPSLWLRFPWGAVKVSFGPGCDVGYWLMWHRALAHPPGDLGQGLATGIMDPGNPALTPVNWHRAPATLLIKIAPILCPHPQALCGFEFGHGPLARHCVTHDGSDIVRIEDSTFLGTCFYQN